MSEDVKAPLCVIAANDQAAAQQCREPQQQQPPTVFEILLALNAAHRSIDHARACILARHPEYIGVCIP